MRHRLPARAPGGGPPAPVHARLLLIGVLALSVGGAGRALPDEVGGRALWVWDRPAPTQVRLAVRQGFDELYVQLRPGAADRQRLRALMRRADRRGIRVWGLGGRPEWASDPAALARFVRVAARTPGLVGIVLDVEPHALSAWDAPAARPGLMRAFLHGLARARRAAGDTPLLVTVPFWYDHDGYRVGGRSLLDRVLARSDGIVVLAYRDHADGRDGIVDLARHEVVRAGQMGKRAVIGVQTAADELDKLSFAEEGAAAMNEELARVRERMLGLPGFAGVAVHHFDSLRSLPRR